MAGKGGGAWKVAYADFVTAMMAFFMVMWLISQSDKVKQSVAQHFRNETGRFAQGDSLLPPRHSQYFKDRRPTAERGQSPHSVDAVAVKSRQPNVLAINNGYKTLFGAVIVFPKDSSELTKPAEERLAALIPQIVGKPQKIEIRGHSSRPDLRPESADQDAWKHSFERCVNVLRFLEAHGIPADRCRLSQAGAAEPYTMNESHADEHSRVEVFLLSELPHDSVGTRERLEERFKTADGE